jgi:hypothetical protein
VYLDFNRGGQKERNGDKKVEKSHIWTVKMRKGKQVELDWKKDIESLKDRHLLTMVADRYIEGKRKRRGSATKRK